MHKTIMKKLLVFLILLLLISCDKEVGEHGVVQDAATGERIADVEVYLISDQGESTRMTDSIGYFNNYIFFSCGIGSCKTDYNLTFEKNGFETLTIDSNFSRSSNAEYVTQGNRDTLIVKMEPN